MVVQALIDSLSRCLGTPAGLSPDDELDGIGRSVAATPQHHQHHSVEHSMSAKDSRRRHQNGQGGGRTLGLDSEFDVLFPQNSPHQRSPDQCSGPSGRNVQNIRDSPSNQSGGDRHARNAGRSSTPLRDKVVGYDNVVKKARAKISSKSTDSSRSKGKKRKSSLQDIFRTKNFSEPHDNMRRPGNNNKGFMSPETTMCGMTPPKYTGNQTSSPLKDPFSSPMEFMTRMYGYGGLCFAAPIRDSDDEDDIPLKVSRGNMIPSIEPASEADDDYDDNGDQPILSQESVNSGLFNHAVETQPPMPLFDRYKVKVDNNANELMGIVSSDTHSSVHMMKMFAADQGDDECLSSIVMATPEQTEDLLINDSEEDESGGSRSRSSTRSRSVSAIRAKKAQADDINTRSSPQGSPVASEQHYQSRKTLDASNSHFHKVVDQQHMHLTASQLGRHDKPDYDEVPEMCNSSNSTMHSSFASSHSHPMKSKKQSMKQDGRAGTSPRSKIEGYF